MKALIFATLTILLVGCGNNSEIVTVMHDRFDSEKAPVSPFEIETDLITNPSLLSIVDSFLIIHDVYNSSKGIHILNKNSLELLNSIGTIGRGPSEISQCGAVMPGATSNIWVCDLGKKKIWYFPLDSATTIANYLPTRSIDFPKNHTILMGSSINDSIIQCSTFKTQNDQLPNYCIIQLNTNTGACKEISDVDLLDDIEFDRRGFYFSNSGDGEKFILGFQEVEQIVICENNGETKLEIHGPNFKNLDNKTKGFVKTVLAGNSIVALYHGKEPYILDDNLRPKANLASTILIFNMQGNLLESIEVESGLWDICVDNENGRIIGYFPDRDRPLGIIYYRAEL